MNKISNKPDNQEAIVSFVSTCLLARFFILIGICLSSLITAYGQYTPVDNQPHPSNQNFELNVLEVLELGDPPADWGIRADINQPGGYVRIKLQAFPYVEEGFDPPYAEEEFSTLLYIQQTADPGDGSFVHDPGYIFESTGPVLENDFRNINLDFDISDQIFSWTILPGFKIWDSDQYKRAVGRAFKDQKNALIPVSEDPLLKVRLVLEMADATLHEIQIPGMDPIIPTPTMFGKGIQVIITRQDGSVDTQIFGTYTKPIVDNEIVFDDSDPVISTLAGDKVEYKVFGMETSDDPIIQGVPKIFPVTFAAQRQFLTIPDYGPNQYYPWFAFEAQTHFRKINSYPNSFVPKTDDWDETGYLSDNIKSWTWYAQRRTDPSLTQYKPNVYYPKTRSNQRESQSLGWAAQFIHYYNSYVDDPASIPKFITGFDIDDWLIPENNVALTTYNYTESDGATTNQNWQHMWPFETEAAISPNLSANDIVVNSVLAGGNFPQVWDGERGFPKAGFTTNDMITAYLLNKTANDSDQDTNLQDDYYFNGYEIEDKGTFYVNPSTTPSQLTSGLVRDEAGNMPVPCDFDCWFNAAYSQGNTKHPGSVAVVLDELSANSLIIRFRQEVKSPIEDASANVEDGFFGSLEGDQWPMGYGNESTYSLKGVKQEDVDNGRISIAMLEYQDGAMIPTKVFQSDEMTYDAGTKKLSATFKIYSAWMALAAYYKSADGQDSVIIAGRVPMVMDPLTSLTIPGSNPLPYDNKSLAQDNSITPNFFDDPTGWLNQQISNAMTGITDNPDLIEGQGDRSFETMNEFRKIPDPANGYSMQNGEGFSKKYVREYVLGTNTQVTFSCIGPGRKIQSFWTKDLSKKRDDPYQSWRELAKRMPQDIVGQRVSWSVYKIDPETGNRIPGALATQTVRHFPYTFTEEGAYEVQLLFNGDTENPTVAEVKVKQFDPKVTSTSYDDLKFSKERADVEVSLLAEDERLWLLEYGADPVKLDDYRVAEIADMSSYYAYALAPRANEYQHREGAYNDMNNVFTWYVSDKTFVVPDEFKPINHPTEVSNLVNPTSVASFLNETTGFDPVSTWPASWSGIWANHIPGKATEDALQGFTRFFEGNPSQASQVEQYIGNTFSALDESQSVLGWIRWYPWIAHSPSEGFKFNRYVKTTLNIRDFFDNGGLGVFSGKADLDIGNVSNAVASMDWYDYGSPEAQRPGSEELQRHLSDEFKNKLEFYYDLKAGRKVVLDITEVNDKKIFALNFNPFLGDGEVNSGRPDLDIYVAGEVIDEEPVASEVVPLSDIPLLTFSGARLDLKHDLGYPYTISTTPETGQEQLTYELVHNGFDRFLEFTAPALNDGSQAIELELGLPIPINEEVNLYGLALAVSTDASSGHFNVSVDYVDNNDAVVSMGPSQSVPASGGADLEFRLAASAFMKKVKVTVSRSSAGPLLNAEVIRIDNIRLLKEETDYLFNKPSFTSADPAERQAGFDWLAESSYRFFNWNFETVGIDEGVFLESAAEDKVSLSGLGMGIAVAILSAESGYLQPSVAKDRVHRVLRWIDRLNQNNELFNGELGWHGMPSHYYTKDQQLFGETKINPETGQPYSLMDISTIDWAICAMGIRAARQYFNSDAQIVQLSTDLLMRVDWSEFLVPEGIVEIDPNSGDEFISHYYYQDTRGRLVLLGDPGYETQEIIDQLITEGLLTVLRNAGRMALNVGKETGEVPILGNAWGQTFSEEAELLYLEVLASNAEKDVLNLPHEDIDINRVIYVDRTPYEDENGSTVQRNEPHKVIYRKKKIDFIPNYNGSGFTYNWLQLWAGNFRILNDDPASEVITTANTSYFPNSQIAYGHDYDDALSLFGQHYMGLTAASTVSSIQPNGFIDYGNYLGNQGSTKNLAPEGEVVQLAPAPYGTVLAMPFLDIEVREALQAYVDLGYYHEYMGLPDNVVLKNIGSKKPLPNWEQLDINMAPIAMAIDQEQNQTISTNFLQDSYARSAYIQLYLSFENDYAAEEYPWARYSSSEATETTLGTKEEPIAFGTMIYPNPTNGDFNVRIRVKNPGNYDGYFYDSSGRIIRRVEWELSESGSYDLPVEGLGEYGLPDGLYYMVVVGGDGKAIMPVILRH